MQSTLGSIPPILLVGCGRMGSAMFAGWREQGLAPSYAVDPAESAASFAGPDMTVVADAALIPAGFAPAAVVLAVKPQNAAATLPTYTRFAGKAVFQQHLCRRQISGRGIAAQHRVVSQTSQRLVVSKFESSKIRGRHLYGNDGSVGGVPGIIFPSRALSITRRGTSTIFDRRVPYIIPALV